MADWTTVTYWIVFIGLSIAFIYISRKALRHPHSHGFYRFFAFELTATLIILSVPIWFFDPFSWNQILSWILLIFSIIVLIEGVHYLRLLGHGSQGESAKMPATTRDEIESSQFQFEKTTTLVESGIYKYIRHPMYSSIFFLAWGAFLKNITWFSIALIACNTGFGFLTAILDERECIQKFGDQYRKYISKTKRFIPFLL